jgi:hypothetical protein
MYTGWGLASGTQCAMSLSPFSLWYLTVIAVPSSDACAARPPRTCSLRRLCLCLQLQTRHPLRFGRSRAEAPRRIPRVSRDARPPNTRCAQQGCARPRVGRPGRRLLPADQLWRGMWHDVID